MEFFNDSTEQTRWLTAIFMGCVIIGGAIFTHRLTKKREKNKLMLDKLDEIRTLSIEYKKYVKYFFDIPSVFINKPIMNEEHMLKWREYKEIHDQLVSLIDNYAPCQKDNIINMYGIVCRATLQEKIGHPPDGVEDNFEGYKDYYYRELSEFDALLSSKIQKYA